MTSARTWLRHVVTFAAAAALTAAAPATWASAAGKTGVRQCSGQAGWRAPVEQRYAITSGFGKRTDPITGNKGFHAGVDLAMQPGPGPVVAAHAGTVVHAGGYGGLGNEVTLRHGEGVQTLYGHMAQIDPTIKPGAEVGPGQKLGVEGSTGHSTGNHVHFEVLVHRKPVDPVGFMARHAAVLNGRASTTAASAGFALPAARSPRKASRRQRPLPMPAKVMDLYVAAGQKYQVPWPLLAGVGMEETAHGRNDHRSSAGAMGLMQFLPSTFDRYGVDGDHNGKIEITNHADSIYSAAHALAEMGVKDGASGVRRALFGYNHVHWYVNDVLYYAAAYAAGSHGTPCSSSADNLADTDNLADDDSSDSTASPAPGSRVALGWAQRQVGHRYRFGANGPQVWDSSSFVRTAYAKAGTHLPRTAQAQRNWLASGHGTKIEPGHEEPGDLIFEDSYLGPKQIGFVQLVENPRSKRGIADYNRRSGVTSASYAGSIQHKHIFEIWRPH